MMASERYTAQEVIEAIKDTFGIKSTIAKHLGCSRWTVDRYIKQYATVRKAYDEERERPVDIAEIKHFEKVQEGHWGAIKYMLSTRGKDRGYVERKEITGAEGEPLEIRYIHDWRQENG